MGGYGSRVAPERSVVAYEHGELLAALVQVMRSRSDWDHLLAYGEDEWERHRAEIVATLGTDLGTCPPGRDALKALAKCAILSQAWVELLRLTAKDLADTRTSIPLGRGLVPIELGDEPRAFWNGTLARLGLSEREGQAFMEAFSDEIGGRVPNLGDIARLPHGVTLMRIGAFHLVPSDQP